MPGLRSRLAVAAVVAATTAAACAPPPPPPPPPPTAPNLAITPVVGSLAYPWDVDWLPGGTILFTQRAGGLYVATAGTVRQLTGGGTDFWASGETGMMGLAVDPSYATTNRVYTCQGSTEDSPQGHGNTVKVVAWQLDAGLTSATRQFDVVTGIDATSGRHGGCRLEFGPDRALWVTTGDAAFGTNPQDLGSLAGKVLRVDPDQTNKAWPGNPYQVFGAPSLIYNYGHRNVQGISRRSDGTMWTAEHGTDRDDEVNVVVAGGNYGWDPIPLTYNEGVPMTNLAKFPGAVSASWASGFPTVAPSGMTWLNGAQWGPWQGALALATLKDSRLRIQFYSGTTFAGEQIPAPFDKAYGRLRTAQQGPNGCLYVLTGNGSNDLIVQACPS